MENRGLVSYWKLSTVLAASLVLILSLSSCSDSGSPTEPLADPAGTGGTGSGGGTSDAGDSGSGGTGDGGSDDGSTSGTLAINMIDDPTDEICQLWVYIRDIRAKPDGQSPLLLGTEIGAFELLELQEGPPAPLGEWVVDAGTYQFIEMLLDESQSYVIEVDPDDPGTAEDPNCLEAPADLQIPSAKFKVNGGPFSVAAETMVTIDFDAKNSLKRKGSAKNPKGWQLNPKVSIVGVVEE